MMNANDYLAMNKSIALTMEEWHTIASALQVAFYANKEEAAKLNSPYYANQAEKCWALFEKSFGWFPDYAEEDRY